MTGSVQRAVAGSEAAFPTPCLDAIPCPVVVSVVGTQGQKQVQGKRTARCWARAEAPGIPNQPDRRSPGPRGGEHG